MVLWGEKKTHVLKLIHYLLHPESHNFYNNDYDNNNYYYKNYIYNSDNDNDYDNYNYNN